MLPCIMSLTIFNSPSSSFSLFVIYIYLSLLFVLFLLISKYLFYSSFISLVFHATHLPRSWNLFISYSLTNEYILTRLFAFPLSPTSSLSLFLFSLFRSSFLSLLLLHRDLRYILALDILAHFIKKLVVSDGLPACRPTRTIGQQWGAACIVALNRILV